MTTDDTVPGLAEAVETRRQQMNLTIEQLIERTGVTRQGLANLRAGKRRRYQERFTWPICAALGWTPDSIDRLLRGEPPVLAATLEPDLEPSGEADEVAALRAELRALRARVDALEDAQPKLQVRRPARAGRRPQDEAR